MSGKPAALLPPGKAMSALLSFLRNMVFAGALIVASGNGAFADEVRLTLPEARKAAVRLLQAGQPEAALILAEGVLLGAPGDVHAMLLKARAQQELGLRSEASRTAKQAWRGSSSETDRFFSAMVRGGTYAANGQSGVAQYWFRRAAQIAPEDAMRIAAVQDFRRLRSATPWRLSLGLKFAPSDNLNGASKSSSSDINGVIVRPGSRPLPGVRYGITADYSYRYALSKTARLKFGIDLELTRAQLTNQAKESDPTADNNDYREDSFGVSVDYEARAADGRWLASMGLDVHRNGRRGEAFSDSATLSLFYGRALGRGLTLSGRAKLRHEVLVKGSGRDLTTHEFGLALGKQFASGRLRLDAWHGDTQSDLYLVAKQTNGVQLSFFKARPIKGMLPRIGVGYRDIDYDGAPFPFLSTQTRHDQEWNLSVDVLLPQVDFYGFAPEIGISYRDRTSNYGIYESEGTDLRLGIKSVF